jgi:ankyrin repeat protein
MASLLLSAGAEVNLVRRGTHAEQNNGSADRANQDMIFPALLAISGKTSERMIDLLVAAGADVNQDNDEYTPIKVATLVNNGAVIRKLASLGAKIDVLDSQDDSLLMIAASGHRSESVKALISVGIDVNYRNKRNGKTALMEVSKYVEGDKTDEASIIVKALVDAGADVNLKAKGGSTALITAASIGNANIVKLLLAARANVNDATEYGRTALMYSAQAGHFENIKALIENGADVNLKDVEGNAALKYAIEYNMNNKNVELIRYLRSNGAVQ